MHIVACLCLKMTASLAVYVCPPHSCMLYQVTPYSTLPGDAFLYTIGFVYETPYFLAPFSILCHVMFYCVTEETDPFCQRCNICARYFPCMKILCLHVTLFTMCFSTLFVTLSARSLLLTDIIFFCKSHVLCFHMLTMYFFYTM